MGTPVIDQKLWNKRGDAEHDVWQIMAYAQEGRSEKGDADALEKAMHEYVKVMQTCIARLRERGF